MVSVARDKAYAAPLEGQAKLCFRGAVYVVPVAFIVADSAA